MKNYKSGFAKILILIIVVLIIAGVVYYFYTISSLKPEIFLREDQSLTKDWRTYSNTKYGFEIKYPTGFNVFMREYPSFSSSGGMDSVYFTIQKGSKLTDFNGETSFVLSAQFQPYVRSLDLKKYVNTIVENTNTCSSGNCANDMSLSIKNTKVSGIDAIQQETSGDFSFKVPAEINTYFLKDKNALWSFAIMHDDKLKAGYNQAERQMYNQMISSFKFTN
jgi:uncharacterized protein YxeA